MTLNGNELHKTQHSHRWFKGSIVDPVKIAAQIRPTQTAKTRQWSLPIPCLWWRQQSWVEVKVSAGFARLARGAAGVPGKLSACGSVDLVDECIHKRGVSPHGA